VQLELEPIKKVSVIVPWLVKPHETQPACLQSVLRQTLEIQFEVILAANGPHSHGCESSCPGVKVVREEKPGPAAARNAGVRVAEGEVLAFIDADCTATEGWLAAAIRTLRKCGPVIVAGAITRSGVSRNWVSLYDRSTYLRQQQYVRSSGACVTANLVVHRDVFACVGPFDERFVEAACEDWDWSQRAHSAGVEIVFDAEAAVDHPCMARLAQLRAKAERLARGELRLRRKLGQGSGTHTLARTVLLQFRRARRSNQTLSYKLRVMCVGVFVAYWTWRATRDMLLVWEDSPA
jgi:GT2 family glycosyltransferase